MTCKKSFGLTIMHISGLKIYLKIFRFLSGFSLSQCFLKFLLSRTIKLKDYEGVPEVWVCEGEKIL